MHNYYVGSSVFAGIVNVKSYSGEIGATQIDPNSLVVEYEGFQQQREFYSPHIRSRKNRKAICPISEMFYTGLLRSQRARMGNPN